MADTFLNLGLIYVAIALFSLGYYYFDKAILSNRQTAKKESLEIKPTVAEKTTEIIEQQKPIVSITEKKQN